jgi:rare lipoprotein A
LPQFSPSLVNQNVAWFFRFMKTVVYTLVPGILVVCCMWMTAVGQVDTSAAVRKAEPEMGPAVGTASYVSPVLDGRRTASGERYDQTELTAAHRYHPFGTRLRVTNLSNEQAVVVRVNDRGPYYGGRILDVSFEAARHLQFVDEGITRVRIEVICPD